MTANEIRTAIDNIRSYAKPTQTTMYNYVHSDGLVETHQEHHYGEPILSLRTAIWRGSFSIAEKLELNEALASKLKY